MNIMSTALSNSLNEYKSFLPFIEAYAVWSRSQTGAPAHYKCFLGKSGIEEKEKEYLDSLPILTDEDAEIIDQAAASVTYQSSYKHKLFEILVLSGWDCVDVYFSIPFVKKLLRKNNEKFSVPILEAKKRDLIEAVRNTLILFEDSEFNSYQ